MKKIINSIFLLTFFIVLTSGINVFAYTFNTSDISKNTYVIGKTMYTRERVGNYTGSLTTEYIMLAAGTIESRNINDMIIYYKNASGTWLNALTGDKIDNMAETVEIININGVGYYTVTFNYGDDNIQKEGHLNSEKIEKPTDPTRDGYTFNGWYVDDEKFNFDTPITCDIELKAMWIADIYDVIFKVDDKVFSNEKIQYNDKVPMPTNPTKEGYTFSKWQLNGEDFNFDTPIISNIELNAVWTKNEYIVQTEIVDEASTDFKLIVTENGKEIAVKEIKKLDGTSLCNGSVMYVNKSEIKNIDTFIVVLEDDTEVEAKKAS